MSKFAMGKLVVTAGIDEQMKNDSSFRGFVQMSIGRFSNGDWGNMDSEDKQQNEQGLKDGERLMGVYIRPGTDEKIWIITEWDRSVTTVLYPHEY